ncbi:MAG: hypothetical protein HYY84_08720 [Deltaproteobacteria bacterium]|nr:hypothetical protein [Deltaproteobacteria bacterium]
MKPNRRWAIVLVVPIAFVIMNLIDTRPYAITLVYDVTALDVGEPALDVQVFREGDKLLSSHITRVPGRISHPVRLAQGDYTLKFVVTPASGEPIRVQRTIKVTKEETVTVFLSR